MTVTYQREDIVTLWPELRILIAPHWKEYGTRQDIFSLDVDEDAYNSLHEQRKLLTMTARNDNALVGYHVHALRRHPHRRAIASSDSAFYVAPMAGAMRAIVCRSLLRASIRELREIGVEMIVIRSKEDHPIDRLLVAEGFSLVEKSFLLVPGE